MLLIEAFARGSCFFFFGVAGVCSVLCTSVEKADCLQEAAMILHLLLHIVNLKAGGVYKGLPPHTVLTAWLSTHLTQPADIS